VILEGESLGGFPRNASGSQLQIVSTKRSGEDDARWIARALRPPQKSPPQTAGLAAGHRSVAEEMVKSDLHRSNLPGALRVEFFGTKQTTS